MGHLTNTRLVSALMVVCKLEAPTIGKLMHQLLIGPASDYSWQWQKFMDFLIRVLTLSWLFHKLILKFQSTWNYHLVLRHLWVEIVGYMFSD